VRAGHRGEHRDRRDGRHGGDQRLSHSPSQGSS
jgi:hypothetical protein